MSGSVVMLPGMMCDARLWHAQRDALVATGFEVRIGDLSRDDSVAAMAARILVEAPPRFALAGLSMGGIVAFEIWRRASDRVTHLALLDTNPHAELTARQALRVDEIAAVRAGRLREVVVESMKPRYLAASRRTDTVLRSLITDMAIELGAAVFERQSIAVRDRVDSKATLASIDVPTLVMTGREDHLCPLQYHLLMAESIPHADLVVLADSGHLPPLEQPEAVTQELRRWLART